MAEIVAGRVDGAGMPLRCPAIPGSVTPLFAGRPCAGMAARRDDLRFNDRGRLAPTPACVRVSPMSNMRQRVLRYVFFFGFQHDLYKQWRKKLVWI